MNPMKASRQPTGSAVVAEPPPPATQPLIDLLNDALKRRHWSPLELAKRSKTPHPTVYDTLQAKSRPNPRTLRAWATALDLPESTLLVAAGHMDAKPEDAVARLAEEIAIGIRKLPKDKQSTAIAALRGMLQAMTAE